MLFQLQKYIRTTPTLFDYSIGRTIPLLKSRKKNTVLLLLVIFKRQ